MKEKSDRNMEKSTQKLESGIDEKEEAEELQEITVENEEDRQKDWEDEDADSVSPWVTAAAMAGIVVLAAIICAVLWHFTHLEPKDSGDGSRQAASTGDSVPGSQGDSEVSSSSMSVPTPMPEASSAEQTPVPTASPTPMAPEATSTPVVSRTPTPPPASVQELISGTTAMEFTQDSSNVTPKDVINLRSEPSTLNADNIVAQAKNGEVLSRTGINESTGWSRIEYNGGTLYAVSQYLTTDLNYKTPVQAADPNRVGTMDGRIIIFTDCSDNITPKEYVNLRTEPSTSEGESTVRCQISNGETVHRTGYSPDAGWSRVEYNGEILYVVSSYMYTVE